MNVGFASVGDIDQIWPLIAVKMNEMCNREDSRVTSGQLFQMCRSGGAFLILAHKDNRLLMASVWTFEDERVMRCWGLVGENMRLWFRPVRDFILGFAQSHGAKKIISNGRYGWLKLIPEAKRIDDGCEVKLDG